MISIALTPVSDRRQARLLEDQPTCRITHSNFKIAKKSRPWGRLLAIPA
ncbi:MAG: hypothetical protein VB142_11065 [Burkholderia sp.]